MAISLGPFPTLTQRRPRIIQNGNDLKGPLGGRNLRLNRKGARHALDLDVPLVGWGDGGGKELAADLSRGETTLVQYPFPQPGLADIGSEGTPRVNGASQRGTTLAVDGVTADLIIPKGTFVNVTTAGRVRLYQLSQNCQASTLGAVDLVIWPEIRVSPADNDVVTLKGAVIEGYVEGDGSWNLGTVGSAFSFSIVEPD